MLWKTDPAVDAARAAPGWVEFHKECAKDNLFFDHIERDGSGRRSPFRLTAFTLVRKRDHAENVPVAVGRGATPIAALDHAYRAALAAGWQVGSAEPWMVMLLNPPTAADDFDDILCGEGSPDEMEDLLG